MKLLALGSIVLTALVLAPGAQAAVFADVDGSWFWQTDGYVKVISGTGAPAHAVIFVDDDGSYFYRVAFDPAGRSYVQCVDGEGFLFVSGATVPTTSCSLSIQGDVAIPRAAVGATAGELPTPIGRYLGTIGAGLSGSGVFRIA